MAGDPHPVFDDDELVQKGNARSYLPLRIGTADELRGLNLTSAWFIFISDKEGFFERDTSDTTSPDDDEEVIVDGNGNRWIRFETGDGSGAVSSVNSKTGAVKIEEIIHDASNKTTPDNTDELVLNQRVDSPASNLLRRLTWVNLKATLKTYFDGLYIGSSSVREKLAANRTYYVRTDGSDSNDGLTNNSGGAFLTLQKAINVIAAIDIGLFNVTIQVADGTYTAGATVTGPWLGSGSVTVLGNTTTPANVIISTTSSDCFRVLSGARLIVSGMELRTTTGGICLKAERNGYIAIGTAMRFGTCADTQLYAITGGYIECFNNFSIVGSPTNWHAYAAGGGRLGIFPSTVTLSGTPAWGSSMLLADTYGFIDYRGMSFSGSATGKRYACQNLGTINTGGGGTSFYPGNSAGTGTTPGTSPYGLYL